MQELLLGTYTHQKSEGIYHLELNENEGAFTELGLVCKTTRPSYVDYNHGTKQLFSVLEGQGTGGIAVWDYQPENKKAQLKHQVLIPGKPPCYVKYCDDNQTVYDANFHDGKTVLYKNGQVKDVWQYPKKSQIHFADFKPGSTELFLAEYGLNKILKYQNDQLIAEVQLPNNSGPRNLTFHPREAYIYVLCQLSNQVLVLEDLGEEFKVIQNINMLKNPETPSDGAAIRISQDGKFVYASNRGEDTIVTYKVLGNGQLEIIDHISTYGEHPRDFDITPSQKYLVVANLHSNNLTLYRRNTTTGKLKLVSHDFFVPEPTCIRFI